MLRVDLAKVHLKWKRTPYQANRIVAVVGSMYSFAAKRGLRFRMGSIPRVELNVIRRTAANDSSRARSLCRLGTAIRKAQKAEGIAWDVDETKSTSKHVPKRKRRTVIGPHAAAAIRLLLFTGCRLREILHLKWRYVDFERGLLFLPDSKTGKKTVVLNAPALTILSGLDRVGEYVVAGDDPGRTACRSQTTVGHGDARIASSMACVFTTYGIHSPALAQAAASGCQSLGNYSATSMLVTTSALCPPRCRPTPRSASGAYWQHHRGRHGRTEAIENRGSS